LRTKRVASQLLVILVVSLLVGACGGKPDRPPVVTSGPPPPPATTTVPVQELPETDVDEGPDELIRMDAEDPLGIRETPLDVLNDPNNNPFADVRFDFDSAALSAEARATLDDHASTLSTYRNMTILVEGHCDERGTVEYNLALGERRANAIFNYLVSLGIDASRLKTISYGKEFPLDPGHDESAWSRNRRGHFEITAK
jgi:peptidoglycan-associated lipoprotein